MTDHPTVPERELTSAVSLTTADGRRLNPDAVGWARTPLVDTSGIDGRRRWGRNKRWEYWNVITPTHIVGVTLSSLDYAAVHEIWVFERGTGREWGKSATVIPATGVQLPRNLGGGLAIAGARDLAITITPTPDGQTWRLHGEIPDAAFDITVSRPERHDCLAVVVPWSPRLFQYTVKDVALRAAGTITVDGAEHDVPAGSWAVLDHGRGRWPYDIRWNWGAGAGVSDGRTFGIQVGGKWTAGTGSTENAVVIDGVLHKISAELEWTYDLAAPLQPWRVRGGGLDATLTPFHDKRSATNLLVLAGRTDQCFGVWSGTFDGIAFEGIEGFAEDVHNRW